MISTAYSLTFQQPVAEPKKPTQGINLSDPICLCSPLFKHPPFNSQWQGQKTTQDIVLSHLIYPCSPLLKHPLFNSLWQGLALTQSVYALHYSNTHLSTACDNQKTTQDIVLSHLICPCSPLFKHPFFNSLWQGKKKHKKNRTLFSLTQSVYALHCSNTHFSTACDSQKITKDSALSDPICLCSPLFQHSPFNSLWLDPQSTHYIILSDQVCLCSQLFAEITEPRHKAEESFYLT